MLYVKQCWLKQKENIIPHYYQNAAKWQSALCKTCLFAGQMGNGHAENAFAALIRIGSRLDVKQLCLANEILRIPFQCQSWRKFLWMNFKMEKSQIFSFFLVKIWT